MKAIRALCISVVSLLSVVAAYANDDTAWSEQKVTAPDGRANTYFGTAAAVSGSFALIGAYGDSNHHGAAYIETRTGAEWSETQKIVADDGLAGDEFGYRVAIQPDRIFVTAYNATIGTNTAQGSAYVFENGTGSWAQVQKLTADDGAVFDNFGQSIAIDGSVLVIGANGATIGDQGAQGAAYVFVYDGTSWTQGQKLIADDGDMVDNFGVSAAIGDETIFIGSPYAAVNGHANQGAVYVFQSSATGWTQVDKLTASDGATNDSFGMSMSLDGTTLVIGATGADGHGAAYVFEGFSGTSWMETQKLVADDAGSGDNFGDAIGLSGSDVLIAADVSTVDGNTSRGAGYLFTGTSGTWVQSHKFIASDGTTDDFLGAAAAYDGETAILSSPHPVINGHAWEGAAYFYARDTLFTDGFDG
ncbi:MAG TPA: FG-GAP repeat protein [Rhodanobacteraceae bacterium]|nr:FG-GAP repeat protein [Rhodanobacteraceae bacterium]